MAKLYLNIVYQHIMAFLLSHPGSRESQIKEYLYDKTSLEYPLRSYLDDLEMLQKVECDDWADPQWSVSEHLVRNKGERDG